MLCQFPTNTPDVASRFVIILTNNPVSFIDCLISTNVSRSFATVSASKLPTETYAYIRVQRSVLVHSVLVARQAALKTLTMSRYMNVVLFVLVYGIFFYCVSSAPLASRQDLAKVRDKVVESLGHGAFV